MPAASGGNGTLMYTVSRLPAGVTMDSTRSISGAPTRSGSDTAIITARDRDGDTATIRFAWTVSPGTGDLAPTFGSNAILNRDWIVRQSITSFTAPAATGGDGTLTYAAEGLPGGVTMSAARLVSGQPTASGFGTARITAQDADGDLATLTFHWTVTTASSNGLTAAPNPSTDGTFIVSGSLTTPDPNSYLTYQMIETEPDGAKNTHSIADPNNISLSFSGKSDGTYSYQMQRCDYYSTSTLSGFVCTDIGSPLSVKVGLPAPGALMGPDTDADGTYTIAWSAVSGVTSYDLQQSRNGAPWADTPVTGRPTSKAFTVQESGEYQYRIRACDAARCSDWSAIKMVLVILPPTVGFDSTYVVRTGDLGPGNDNDTDIYLSPLATGTGNVGEFILRNDNGTFALETSPSIAQLASAQSWTVSTQVEIVLEDVNVDGVWDAFVTGITGAPSTANFKGAVDQIVVSPATSGGKPTGLVAVDSDLKSFINSVMAWYENLNHFDKPYAVDSEIIFGGSTTATGGLQQLVECRMLWGNCFQVFGSLADHYGSYDVCVSTVFSHGANGWQACADGWHVHAFARLTRQITRPDFTGLPYEVSEFVRIWTVGEESHDVEDLADVLEDVLGITIGGYDFSDTSHDDLDEPTEQRIFEVHQGLLNINALFGRAGRRYADDYRAGNVIVTKRRVGGVGWLEADWAWHMALEWTALEEYPALMDANPTIAAYLRGMLQLKSERNHPSERTNKFVGIVSSTDPSVSAFMWLALVESDRKYRSCPALGYALSRGDTDVGKYNSNGFVAGIINSIGATTNAPLDSFYLGDVPVPTGHFESYCAAED